MSTCNACGGLIGEIVFSRNPNHKVGVRCTIHSLDEDYQDATKFVHFEHEYRNSHGVPWKKPVFSDVGEVLVLSFGSDG